ncbi:hypothetical protein D9611_010739 [Ephemerocybe angulata]|uniref:Uncharacterized protein n=1 Tax=Ephemerocybe angulata TaxID=980116 RepID=A0A8H5BBQ9_9AGAR|nr:hypothetical protein D9611_010739 [Tulosesus angulatus]
MSESTNTTQSTSKAGSSMTKPKPKQKQPEAKSKRPSSKYLWYSGWELSPDSFERFMRTLPRAKQSGASLDDYIMAYDSWRSRAIRGRSAFTPPVLRTRNVIIDDEDSDITAVFFPIRGIEYRSDAQIVDGHPNAARIKTVTEQDIAKLEAFRAYVKECEGEFDASAAYFSFKKCLHPNFDNGWMV